MGGAAVALPRGFPPLCWPRSAISGCRLQQCQLRPPVSPVMHPESRHCPFGVCQLCPRPAAAGLVRCVVSCGMGESLLVNGCLLLEAACV
jgi:hypothetical protein